MNCHRHNDPRRAARPRRHVRLALALRATSMVLIASLATAAVAGELDSSAAFDALCRLSEPDPSSEAAAAAVLLTSLEGAPGLTDTTRSTARRAYSGRRTAAMLETWQLSVPADAWTVVDSDGLVGEITVGAWGPLSLFPDTDDALVLDEELVTLPCDAEAIEAARVAHAAGLATLDVEIELAAAEDVGATVCTARPDVDGGRQLQGNLLVARIVHTGTGATLCQLRTARADERAVRFAHHAPSEDWLPRVEVTRVDMLAEGSSRHEPLDDELDARVRSEVEAALLPCYQAALCRRGQRQGALSVRATVDGGTLRDPAITVDALDSEAIASCVVQRLERVDLAQAPSGGQLGLVIIFRLVSDLDADLPVRALRDAATSALSGASGLRARQAR